MRPSLRKPLAWIVLIALSTSVLTGCSSEPQIRAVDSVKSSDLLTRLNAETSVAFSASALVFLEIPRLTPFRSKYWTQ